MTDPMGTRGPIRPIGANSFAARLVALTLAVGLVGTAATAEAALSSSDPWSALRPLVQKIRVGDTAGVAGPLAALTSRGSPEFRATASFVLARLYASQGKGQAARNALNKAKRIADIYPPSWAWAEVEVAIAQGKTKRAIDALAKLRNKWPKWRWARADVTYSRLWEKAGPAKKAAEVALKLYPKSRLHLPQDELLHRAARMHEAAGNNREAKGLWKRLLMQHPSSRFIDDAIKRVPLNTLSKKERMSRVEKLFAERHYERCRAEALVLWKKNYRRVELGYFLGKIGSERLRDDYKGAEKYFKVAAVESSPYALFAISSYAIVLAKNGKTDASVKQFDRWLRNYSRSAPVKRVIEAHYDRGRALHTGGRSLQAAEDLRNALNSRRKGKLDLGKYYWFVGYWTYLGGKYRKAIDHFSGLTHSSNALVGGKSRYWTGRAWDKLGKRKKAADVLAKLVRDQPLNYYSGLAEMRLREWGLAKRIPKRPDLSKVADPRLKPFAGLPHDGTLATIRIAAHLGEYDTMRAVFKEHRGALNKQLGTTRTSRLRDDLADELEDYWTPRRRAYSSWKKNRRGYPTAKTVHAWRARYPRAYRTHVVWSAKKWGAPEWMVYAHMLQESRYKPWMISHAPAYGLLELLDRTASRLADDAKEPYQLWMLMVPGHNVRWGTQYLGALYKKFHRQLPFAIGSYNGGPMLLEYHMKISKGMAFDEMVDDMGPHECRNYTRMVIGHFLRYLAIYEKPARAEELRKQLLLGSWQPKYLKYPSY